MRNTLGLFLLSLAGCSTAASQPPPPRSVTIEATATLHLPPDMAAISLTFGAVDDDLGAAHATVERNRGAFLSAIESWDARVERGWTQYSPYRPSHSEVERYQASDTIIVHTAHPEDIPRIIGLASAGLTAVTVRHYVSDLVQHRGRVRAMAIAAAQAKASDLATGFDAELGRVLTIHEGGASQYGGFGVGNNDNFVARVDTADEGSAPPGAIPLRLTLLVTYELD
ncbi:MAG: SIMPL domain-containing protein [Sandaracinaceae bacterium]|nr:SIMPL domain-containing protein [Sandaracinaceae bacterium]